jgi:hypothetical protein
MPDSLIAARIANHMERVLREQGKTNAWIKDARALGCCSAARWIAHITAILNLYAMPFPVPFREGRRRFSAFSIRFSAAARRLS